MFGDKVGYTWFDSSSGMIKPNSIDNILDYNCVTFDDFNSSYFMNEHGYEKAEKATIEESKISSNLLNQANGDLMSDDNFHLSVKDSKISYVKPDELNKFSDKKTTKHSGLTTEIESTSYKLVKPFGQPYEKTYIYKLDQENATRARTIELIGLILQLFF